MTTAERRAIVRYPFVVAAFSFISAVLYIYRLGKPSFWFDESASYVNARLSWHEFGIAIHHRDVFFAAYYAFLHLWMSLGSDEATLRMPSVIGAVAALPCMFALGRKLFGNRAGLAAMILLASNNLFIAHVREARPYAWLALFAILSSLSFLRALDSGKSRDWTWYVAACVVGAYVHIFAILVPIAHGISLVFLHEKRPWKHFFLSFGAIAVAVAPLVFLIIGQETTSGRVFAGHGNPRDLVYLFRIFCG
jgi:mannosyltransferase